MCVLISQGVTVSKYFTVRTGHLLFRWNFLDNAGGTTSTKHDKKIYELKVHSRFKEVGRDVKGGIAGAAAIAVPRRKDF